jgi:hypothetical protein
MKTKITSLKSLVMTLGLLLTGVLGLWSALAICNTSGIMISAVLMCLKQLRLIPLLMMV